MCAEYMPGKRPLPCLALHQLCAHGQPVPENMRAKWTGRSGHCNVRQCEQTALRLGDACRHGDEFSSSSSAQASVGTLLVVVDACLDLVHRRESIGQLPLRSAVLVYAASGGGTLTRNLATLVRRRRCPWRRHNPLAIGRDVCVIELRLQLQRTCGLTRRTQTSSVSPVAERLECLV